MRKSYIATGLMLALAAVVLFVPEVAQAATAPTTADIGFDLYDLAVNKLIAGPPGYIVGAGLVGYGLYAVGAQGDTGTALKAGIAGGGILGVAAIVDSIGSYMGAIV